MNPEKCLLGVKSLSRTYNICAKNSAAPRSHLCNSHFSNSEKSASIRKFIGKITFYHRFIPSAATLLIPLSSLLKKQKEVSPSWYLGQTALVRPFRIKVINYLVYPQESVPTHLQVDACNFSVGYVLQQYQNGICVFFFLLQEASTG